MSRIEEVQKIVREKETQKVKVEPQEPKEVMIDLRGEEVSVNGIKFVGKRMVPIKYASTVKRILQARLDQRRKEREFIEHPDKRSMVSGKMR